MHAHTRPFLPPVSLSLSQQQHHPAHTDSAPPFFPHRTKQRRYAGHALYKDPHKRRGVKPEVVWNIREGARAAKAEVEKV